jgi:hypothetical protein
MGYYVYMIFDLQLALGSMKIEVSSLPPERVINPDELRFPIGLPAD